MRDKNFNSDMDGTSGMLLWNDFVAAKCLMLMIQTNISDLISLSRLKLIAANWSEWMNPVKVTCSRFFSWKVNRQMKPVNNFMTVAHFVCGIELCGRGFIFDFPKRTIEWRLDMYEPLEEYSLSLADIFDHKPLKNARTCNKKVFNSLSVAVSYIVT